MGADGPTTTKTYSDEVNAYWSEYAAATGATGPFTSWGFGVPELPELMTKLGLLVRDGPKRATTGRFDDFNEDEPVPVPGDHSVIIDGDGHPICIIRTTSVDFRPFGEVDEQLAWDEGEGDRTLQWWRDAHIRYFEKVGTPIDETTPMVLERFAKVWPHPADPPTD